MKRVGGLFDAVCDARTLTHAAWRASRGKRSRPPVRAFLDRLSLRYMDDMLTFGDLAALHALRLRAAERLALMGLAIKNGGVLNRCTLGVPWLGFTLYPDRTRLDARGRRRLRRRFGALERAHERGRVDAHELQARATALFAHARRGDDVAWRREVVRLSRFGEAPERPEPRDPRRLLERQGQEVPLGLPQQEEAREPQQEPGLPGLSAPRHGGADTPPDDAPSRALAATAARDESAGRTPVGTEIPKGQGQSAHGPAEKAPAGAPPTERGAR